MAVNVNAIESLRSRGPLNIAKSREVHLPKVKLHAGLSRRILIKSGLALGAVEIAGPWVKRARAADAVKIGLDNPLTGTYAAPGKNELVGCQMALEAINAQGGILEPSGRAHRRGFRPAATPVRRCRRRAS